VNWQEYRNFKAQKELELAQNEVEIAVHKANLAQACADLELLMANVDSAQHATQVFGEASGNEELDTQTPQSLVQKAAASESKIESSDQGSDVDTSNPGLANAAGAGVGQLRHEQRHKNVSSRPIRLPRVARPNPLKRHIAQLRREHYSARTICGELDKLVERGPNRHAPLASWQNKAEGKRSWVDLFEDQRTHNAVKTFINKIQPSTH
jgi:hypothetical protein